MASRRLPGIINTTAISLAPRPCGRVRFMKKPVPPKVRKFPAPKQRRLDQLLDKNSHGTITTSERESLVQLVTEAEQLMVENAKRLAE